MLGGTVLVLGRCCCELPVHVLEDVGGADDEDHVLDELGGAEAELVEVLALFQDISRV